MDVERICKNRTPLVVRAVPMDDWQGRDVLVVVAKLTLAVSRSGVVMLAARPRDVRRAEVPVSNQPTSSLRFPADLVDDKPGTDVLLAGHAHAPKGGSATSMEVSLRVVHGQRMLAKTVRVTGPRVWYKGPLGVAPGPPTPLPGETPLVYELSYGGRDDADPEKPVTDWRNPAGTGFCRDRTRLLGQAVPALEDPEALLSSRSPAPACFGPIAASWLPRGALAGTCDESWRRTRAPLRPLDFDPRHNSCAHPDLHGDAPLASDVAVEVLGATPEGAWRFQLPSYEPTFEGVIRRATVPLPTHLDTILVDADARLVELVWRARVPLPRKTEALESVVIRGTGTLPQDFGP